MAKFRSKSSKYIYILGESFARRKVYLGVLSVLIVVGVLFGVVYSIMRQNGGAQVSAPEVPASAPGVAASTPDVVRSVPEVSKIPQRPLPGGKLLSPLERLLEEHLSATRLDEVNTYMVEGTFGGETSDQKIVLMGRSPNLYKYRTEYAATGVVVKFGYDGEHAWLNHSRQLQLMDRMYAELFAGMAVLESSFTHLAWAYRSAEVLENGLDTVLELLPSETWQGRSCAVVLSRGLLPVPIHHYIDMDTYQEVHRRSKIVNDKGVEVEVSLDFDPPDGSVPYGIPMGYQLFVDGKLHDTVKYTKVQVNRVIMPWLFDAPADSVFTGLRSRP